MATAYADIAKQERNEPAQKYYVLLSSELFIKLSVLYEEAKRNGELNDHQFLKLAYKVAELAGVEREAVQNLYESMLKKRLEKIRPWHISFDKWA